MFICIFHIKTLERQYQAAMCILFPQSMVCSWVNVFYEEICPGNLAGFTVNILAVSFYLVVGLNFYPSLPDRGLQIRGFVRECLKQE